MRIGVIAALAEEADALYPGRGVAEPLGPLAARRIDDVTVVTCGIGKVNAALAATLLAPRSDLLLVIGTAGRIGPLATTGACWIAEAAQHDYGARRADHFQHYSAGAIPIGPAPLEPFRAIADPGSGLPQVGIASGDSFVECATHGAHLAANLNAHVVDMETAAVAQVAQAFGLGWAAIKAVSDGADGDSATTFRENLLRAANEAARAAERVIALLSQNPRSS